MVENHVVITYPPPRYPAEAKGRRLERRGIIRMHVPSDGTVYRITFLKSTGHAVLDTEAKRAFMKCRFRPEETSFVTQLPCDFDLHAKPPLGAAFFPNT